MTAWRRLWRRRSREADLDAELREHITRLADDYEQSGLSVDEARRRARLDFGPLDLAKDECRDTRPLRWLDECLRSVKFAARALRRTPGMALTIVALMSFGIAGIAALFGPLYSLVLSPLRLPQSDQLVRVGGQIQQVFNVYTNTFNERERFQSVFSHITVYAPAAGGSWRTPASSRPITVAGLAVTSEFFETLGVTPRLGRSFADEPTNAPVVVVSDRLWRTQFDRSPDIVGATFGSRTVIGVMPEGFDFPHGVDAWFPLGSTPLSSLDMELVGRMRPGLSLSQAAADLESMGLRPGLGAGLPGDRGPVVQSLQTYLRGDTAETLWALWAVSGAFLLLACVGVANLLLAQGVRRRPEVRVHIALGSSRWRLVRQFLLETLMLVVVGAAGGLWLSMFAGQWLAGQFADLPAGQPFMPATIALVVGLIAVVTLISGLAPALHATRGTLSGSLVSPVENSARSRRILSLREGLAALQLALALGLVIGTGLLVRSVDARMDVPLGFSPDDVVTFHTTLPNSPDLRAAVADFRRQNGLSSDGAAQSREVYAAQRRATAAQIRAEYARNRLFARELTERLAALPDVTLVGVVSDPPFTSVAAIGARAYYHRVSGQSGPQGTPVGETINAGNAFVSPNGLDVLGIPVLAGRSFSEEDVTNAFAARTASAATMEVFRGPVAIINEGLARRLWPGADAVGKYINGGDPARTHLVVGVISDYQWIPEVRADRPVVFFPHGGDNNFASFVIKLRPGASVESFSAEADQIVNSFQYDMPRIAVQQLETLVTAGQHDLRLALKLLGWFAALGTVVASLGAYTAITLLTAARTRELGIRIALGASPVAIRRLLLSDVARLFVAFPVGWALGWTLAKPLSHLLFEVPVIDPVTYAASSGALLTAIAAAILGPILRASAINPASVLRGE